MAADILIVDDEADICELVSGLLQDEGYSTRTARDSDSALNAIAGRRPNLVFLDIWLQGSRLDGLQLLSAVKEQNPDLPVVMISGHGNIETAVAAIKQGAYDFIEKPFKADRLILVADRALETSRLKREVRELKALGPLPSGIVGHSPSVNQLRQTIVLVTHNINESVQLSDRVMVMTARPGQVKTIVDIDLPHPRDSSIITSERFGRLVALVWSALREESIKSFKQTEQRH